MTDGQIWAEYQRLRKINGDRNTLFPAELINDIISYDPITGSIMWKYRPISFFPDARAFNCWNTKFSGKEAFMRKRNGYFYGSIFDRGYFAHRVGWASIHGRWPIGEIDHINGIRSDNRIVNLREVTTAENAKNRRILDSNTSGESCISWNKVSKKWLVKITANMKQKYIGDFEDMESAKVARDAAWREHGFHENHGKRIIGR